MNDSDYDALVSLVYEGRYHVLSEQPIAPHHTWVNAVQTEVILFGIATELTYPRYPLPPYPGVAVVMMIKDESDVILDNLRWMHLTGIRRFAIIDNASSDETWQILEYFRATFRDAEVVLVSDPTVRYLQAAKTTGLFRLAQSYWPDLKWIFAIDADEFLIPMRGFAPLEEVPSEVEALTIPKAIHFRLRGAEGTGVLQRMPLRSTLYCVPPKVVLRADPLLSVSQGNHHAEHLEGRPARYAGALQYGIYYREFPNRSFEHFLKKILNGGRAIMAAQDYLQGGRVGGDHWLAYYQSLQDGGEAELRKIYEEQWCKAETDGLILDPFEVPPHGAVELIGEHSTIGSAHKTSSEPDIGTSAPQRGRAGTTRHVFIDLGANVGELSLDFATRHPDAEIFCVEPNLELIPSILEKSARAGRVFTVLWGAAWTYDGTIDLFESDSHAASTIVAGKVEPNPWPKIDYSRSTAVPCFNFSQWLLRSFAPQDHVVVKMDIEGSEYRVLEQMLADGSVSLVKKLICEWHFDRYPAISAERHHAIRNRVAELTELEDWT